jgi:hypothetical protein
MHARFSDKAHLLLAEYMCEAPAQHHLAEGLACGKATATSNQSWSATQHSSSQACNANVVQDVMIEHPVAAVVTQVPIKARASSVLSE